MSEEISIYYYKLTRRIFLSLILTGGIAIFGWSLVFVVLDWSKNWASEVAWHVWFFIAFSLALAGCLSLLWQHWIRTRPIGISENAIFSFGAPGRIWKRIEWTNVVRIEQIRFYNSLFNEYDFTVTVHGPRRRIRFDRSIVDLNKLLDAINLRAKQLGIKVIFIDMGRDTLRKIDSSSWVKRKSALRSKVAKDVPELMHDCK